MRIVDDCDNGVPQDHPDERVNRADNSWTLFPDCFGDPGATAKAWCNGWCHTGGLTGHDVEGCFFFVDRKTDVIRRRGKNRSSPEVRIEVIAHPAVRECAACAVDLPGDAQQAMAALAPVDAARPIRKRHRTGCSATGNDGCLKRLITPV